MKIKRYQISKVSKFQIRKVSNFQSFKLSTFQTFKLGKYIPNFQNAWDASFYTKINFRTSQHNIFEKYLENCLDYLECPGVSRDR